MKRVMILVLIAGCGFADAPGDPLVVAHRAGAGLWPENSRTALRGALEAGYPAIEIDLALTRDELPVLTHDAWLDEVLCTTAEGAPLGERVYVKDLTLDELWAGYRCGGIADPEMPGAEVLADTHLPLSEMLEALQAHPEVVVHLDVKYQPGDSHPADVMAGAILGAWAAAGLPNRYYVTLDTAEGVAAFEAEDPSATTFLSWPRFPPGESSTAVALGAEAGLLFGLAHPISLVRDAGGDGLSMPYQVIDRMVVEDARAAGLEVIVWTLNDERLLERFCKWPVELIVTDYPERAPCL